MNLELGFMRHTDFNIKKSQELVDWAIMNGINFFETCYFYLDYQCENYIYSLLKNYTRDQFQLCGKLPIHNIIDHKDFKEIYKSQLDKCPEHYFDTYLLQALDEYCIYDIQKNSNLINFFLKEKEKGNIKKFGLSIQCTPEIFEKYLKFNCWDCVQMPLNYFDWFLCRYDENYQLAINYNLPIIAQAPFKGGLLTSPKNIVTDQDLTYLALKFIFQLNNIDTILIGNTSLKTLEITYNNFKSIQNDNDNLISLNIYKNLINDWAQKNKIPCLLCGQCELNCPNHFPIQSFIRLFNLSLNNKEYFNAFDIINKSRFVPIHNCKRCTICQSVCPLNLPIFNLWGKMFEIRT